MVVNGNGGCQLDLCLGHLNEFQLYGSGSTKDADEDPNLSLLWFHVFHRSSKVRKGTVNNTNLISRLKQILGLRFEFSSLHLAEDREELLPGLSVQWVGAHSADSQIILVDTPKGRAAITGDVCYLYQNMD